MATILTVLEKDKIWKQTLLNLLKLVKKQLQSTKSDIMGESSTSLTQRLLSSRFPRLKTETFVIETTKDNWSTTLNQFIQILDGRISMLNEVK